MFLFCNIASCFLNLAQSVTTCLLLCLPLDLKHLEGSTYICFIHNVAQVAIQCQAPESEKKVKSLSCVRLFVAPGSSVHRILQERIQEWVAISFPRQLPDLGIELGSPALEADTLPSEPPGNLYNVRLLMGS